MELEFGAGKEALTQRQGGREDHEGQEPIGTATRPPTSHWHQTHWTPPTHPAPPGVSARGLPSPPRARRATGAAQDRPPLRPRLRTESYGPLLLLARKDHRALLDRSRDSSLRPVRKRDLVEAGDDRSRDGDRRAMDVDLRRAEQATLRVPLHSGPGRTFPLWSRTPGPVRVWRDERNEGRGFDGVVGQVPRLVGPLYAGVGRVGSRRSHDRTTVQIIGTESVVPPTTRPLRGPEYPLPRPQTDLFRTPTRLTLPQVGMIRPLEDPPLSKLTHRPPGSTRR